MKTYDIPPEHRGKGFTSKQLLDAPRGALFIWVNSHLDYPKSLARHLGRDDLKIVSPSVLERDGLMLRGHGFSAIILDHAGNPSEREWEVLNFARQRIERQQGKAISK